MQPLKRIVAIEPGIISARVAGNLCAVQSSTLQGRMRPLKCRYAKPDDTWKYQDATMATAVFVSFLYPCEEANLQAENLMQRAGMVDTKLLTSDSTADKHILEVPEAHA